MRLRSKDGFPDLMAPFSKFPFSFSINLKSSILYILLIISNESWLRMSTCRQLDSAHHYTRRAKNHAHSYRHESTHNLQRLRDGDVFYDNSTATNYTVSLGDTAFLRCRVRNLGERSISWYRRRDWHILTTGKATYTNDERFHVLHTDGTEEWTLQIKFVQRRDNGTYECQVSTGTGIVSYLVHLHIAVPEAFILGNGEYHVNQGSNINLICIIEKSPKAPEFIFWYHNDKMINYGADREVSVSRETGTRIQSKLSIKSALHSDSGNYTCKTPNAEPASIIVYVSQEASGFFSGDKTAAIHRRLQESSGSKISNQSQFSIYLFHLLLTILLLQ